MISDIVMQGSATLAALLEVLDIAALADDGFDIRGGFKAHWRAHVWEGKTLYGSSRPTDRLMCEEVRHFRGFQSPVADSRVGG